ncbi:MAG TPA: type II toxin-antitoxin system VapC family toxin [Anaerolineales bacterium]|nr:type II toxin-antitoxin system VapC family toxin [Anaerolineales bacterium]
MNTYYFDTSALVKLYMPEPGSKWVDALVSAGNSVRNSIAISSLGIVETSAAVARRQRMGTINAWQTDLLYHKFLQDSRMLFETLAVTDELVYNAASLTRSFPLRGYDAVHLATALQFTAALQQAGLAPLTFVSADRTLLTAARASGLKTVNPSEMES